MTDTLALPRPTAAPAASPSAENTGNRCAVESSRAAAEGKRRPYGTLTLAHLVVLLRHSRQLNAAPALQDMLAGLYINPTVNPRHYRKLADCGLLKFEDKGPRLTPAGVDFVGDLIGMILRTAER